MKLSERAQIGVKKKEKPQAAMAQPRLCTRHSDGAIEARDGSGKLLGHYNPRSNETRDHRGDLIGMGNRLQRILQTASQKPAHD